MTEERIQKVLAHLGVGSRRAIEEWIEQGRVAINGNTAQLGDKVGPQDEVRVDGQPVSANAPPRPSLSLKTSQGPQTLTPRGFYPNKNRYTPKPNDAMHSMGNEQRPYTPRSAVGQRYGQPRQGQPRQGQPRQGQSRQGQRAHNNQGNYNPNNYGNSLYAQSQFHQQEQSNYLATLERAQRGEHTQQKRGYGRQDDHHQPSGLYGRGMKKDRSREERVPLGNYRQTQRRVLVYYKPEGEVCTRTDPEGRPTVFDRIPKMDNERWVVVGRLDIATTGLLLFTNDGDLANSLMHPSSQVQREYAVRVYGDLSQEALNNLLQGVPLEDGLAKFSQIIDAGGDGQNHWYHVTISEGRNREVRRMMESQGVQVSRLIRIRFGHVKLPRDWRPGQYQELPGEDIEQLSQQVGVKLKRRTGLYGRTKVRAEKIPVAAAEAAGENISSEDDQARRGGYLRRRRYDGQ